MVIIKAMRLDEVPKGESVDIQEKRTKDQVLGPPTLKEPTEEVEGK